MAKNVNLIYCIKKNGHKSYTGDYQKFMRRRQALGEAGLEYGIFRTKEEAMAYLGLPYSVNTSELTPEEHKAVRIEKRVKRVARIQGRIQEEKARRESNRKKFYAVARGYHQKICLSWEEAKEEIRGYAFPKYLGCDTIEEAAAFIKEFNMKYRGMTEEQITSAIRNEKLQKLARGKRRMPKRNYLLARERILNTHTKDKKEYNEKYTEYRVHLGPKSPEVAERQYRTGTYENYATCCNIKRHKRGS